MQVVRVLPVLALAVGSLFATSSAQAAMGAGCPPGFTLAPVSVLGTDFTGQADNVNRDGLICIRMLKPGTGIFIDNTVP